MKTHLRIFKAGQLLLNTDSLREPSIVRDISAALVGNLWYAGYGDNDIIVDSQMYLYNNTKWLVVVLGTETDPTTLEILRAD